MNWLKNLSVSVLILCLTGCPGFNVQPYWDAFQTWSENYNQPKPPEPPKPPDPPLPPEPDPPPPLPDPGVEEQIIVADLNLIPGQMRQAGFQGSDNALYYVLAHVAAFGPGASFPEHEELTTLASQREQIEAWWWAYVTAIRERLKANPKATAIIIKNDGRDRCGFRLGPPTMERLREFGGRVQMGTVVPASEY